MRFTRGSVPIWWCRVDPRAVVSEDALPNLALTPAGDAHLLIAAERAGVADLGEGPELPDSAAPRAFAASLAGRARYHCHGPFSLKPLRPDNLLSSCCCLWSLRSARLEGDYTADGGKGQQRTYRLPAPARQPVKRASRAGAETSASGVTLWAQITIAYATSDITPPSAPSRRCRCSSTNSCCRSN
jgi:hypothetical protein